MITREEFYVDSTDNVHMIHGYRWYDPEVKSRGILQIVHGMLEYIERYEELAQYMASAGYFVVGHDHLGHGDSVNDASELGYVGEQGAVHWLKDMEMIRKMAVSYAPGVPCIMLGHSMGSILLRQYIQTYGTGLAGALLIGVVAEQPQVSLRFGQCLCRMIALVRGWHYRSKLVDKVVTGSFNKKYKPARTRADWVTGDLDKLDAYVADPLCSFVFTVNAYYHLLEGMRKMQKKESVFMIPKTLPILFAAGTDDPVGRYGKGVRKIYEKYKAAGIRDVSLRLYAGDRHELLNERDRKQVSEDLYHWIEERIG